MCYLQPLLETNSNLMLVAQDLVTSKLHYCNVLVCWAASKDCLESIAGLENCDEVGNTQQREQISSLGQGNCIGGPIRMIFSRNRMDLDSFKMDWKSFLETWLAFLSCLVQSLEWGNDHGHNHSLQCVTISKQNCLLSEAICWKEQMKFWKSRLLIIIAHLYSSQYLLS